MEVHGLPDGVADFLEADLQLSLGRWRTGPRESDYQRHGSDDFHHDFLGLCHGFISVWLCGRMRLAGFWLIVFALQQRLVVAGAPLAAYRANRVAGVPKTSRFGSSVLTRGPTANSDKV